MSISDLRACVAAPFLLLSLAGLSACEPEISGASGDAAGAVEFRSGSTDIAVDFIAGEHACFKLSYACEEPDSVVVTVDSSVALSWTRPKLNDGEAIGMAPPSFCQRTAVLTAASHSFALAATCAGTTTTDVVAATTAPPAFWFASLTASKTTYNVGDAIVLDLDAGADGLVVAANFSAVDSTYSTGGETVQALGGGKYRIRRAMSTSNLRRAGDYVVPVSISDGTAVKTHNISIRWLPSGYPRHTLTEATYLAEGAPTRTTASGTSVVSFAAGTLMPQSPSAPQLFDDLVDDVGARPFTLVFQTPATIGETVRVEMRDTARSGAFLATYPAVLVTGPSPVPQYQLSGLMIGNPLPLGQTNASLQFRVVLPNGTASPWHNDTLGWPGEQGQIIAHGTVSYEYLDCGPDTSAPAFNSPQYFPAKCTKKTKPVRRQMVELTNDCNQRHRQYTNDNGEFTLWLPDACANEDFRVVVHSVTRNENGKRVAVGGWDTEHSGAITLLSQLTANPGDYDTHQAVVGTFDPPFGDSIHDLGNLVVPLASEPNAAWSSHIIDNTLIALDYFGNFINSSDLHQINVSWSANGPDLEGTNVFLPGTHPSLIHLRPTSTNAFPITHEVSHYIHYNFLADGTEYGRFSEPMANTNAAMITKSPWMALSPDSKYESLDINGKFVEDIGGAGVDGFQQADLRFFSAHADFEDCENGPAVCCDFNNDPTAGDPPTENIPLCVQGPSGWTWRLFLDLHDGTGAEPWDVFYPVGGGTAVDYNSFDGVNGGGSLSPINHKLSDVLFGYLGGGHLPQNPNREDRGLSSADLVDVLDGMMCRGHMTESAATHLLWDATNYDYDFQPVSGSCI